MTAIYLMVAALGMCGGLFCLVLGAVRLNKTSDLERKLLRDEMTSLRLYGRSIYKPDHGKYAPLIIAGIGLLIIGFGFLTAGLTR